MVRELLQACWALCITTRTADQHCPMGTVLIRPDAGRVLIEQDQ